MRGAPPIRAKKRLGQHFLRDPAVVAQLIDLAEFQPEATVIEIGPGLGALTLPLAGSVRQVIGIEKDAELVEILRERLLLRGIRNVTLMNQDVLKADFEDLARSAGQYLQVIGNLPFNISSPFLEKLMENRSFIARAVLTFQAEVGRRLIASPGNKDYGAMTVLVQYHARISPLLEIPRSAFSPPPKVESMVLEIDFSRPYPLRASDEGTFRKAVRGAFAHRRKTIFNSLRSAYPDWSLKNISNALEKSRIDPKSRAEVLGINSFIRLSDSLVLSWTAA